MPVAAQGTELALYNPRILQQYAMRPVAYMTRPHPATLSPYHLRRDAQHPVVYARDNFRQSAYSQENPRESLHISSSKDVYTDTDANKLHIQ